ncbi:SurA N-terminal domain-containing protein [Streptomyces sp. NPDC058045]|uniref:SurA N-terminal domain-containing protein n=1 Tax=Streptomyces sp. NPDC058045 TaxID=3346311 RepID=UPI0036ECBB31
MHRRRRRTALVVSSAAMLAAAPLLTACGSDTHPGAAAVVGGERISVAQLQGRVGEVRAAQRSAVQDDSQYQQVVARSGSLTRDTLQSMVRDRVLHKAASDAGVKVSSRDVQALRTSMEQGAGGPKALEATWLQRYGVAPERLDESLRTEAEARKLYDRLGVDGSGAAGQAAFWKRLSEASKSLRIDLNPRYGAWDDTKSTRAEARTPWLRDVSAAPRKQA